MKLFTNICDFLLDYNIFFYIAMFLVVALLFLINCLTNTYRKNNKQISKLQKHLPTYIKAKNYTAIYKHLPKDYQYQWRCYTYSEEVVPSKLITFVEKKNPIRGIAFSILMLLANSAFCVVYAFNVHEVALLVQAIALYCAIVLCFVINVVVRKSQKRNAKQKLAGLLNMLDGCFISGYKAEVIVENQSDDEVIKTVEQINLAKNSDNPTTKIAKILRDKGLTQARTIKEQQKINQALNGLLVTINK